MTDKPLPGDDSAGSDASLATQRRGPGHRGADMRDTVAELAERAQLISQEAGTKVGAAMKDVISAAAGIAGFAIESARDLVQYMVRRGQMTQEEADKLIREAEVAHDRRPASEKGRPTATKIAAEKAAVAKAEAAARIAAANAAAHAAATARKAKLASQNSKPHTPVKAAKKPAAKSAKPAHPPAKAVAKGKPAKAAKTAAKPVKKKR